MDKEQKMNILGNLYEKFHHLHEAYGQLWLNETFLHWDWWIAVFLGISSWVFWIFYRKKESTHRLLYAGGFVILIGLCLDYTGEALGLWYYTGKPNPSFPSWAPYHFCMLPVSIMFLIQTKPHIASWKKGILYGLLTAFVGEPLFVLTGFYVLTGWQYIYSIPIYALIYIFAEWLTKRKGFQEV